MKSVFKVTAVLVLALFQLSFLLQSKTTTEKGRHVAQAETAVGQTTGEGITNEVCEIDDTECLSRLQSESSSAGEGEVDFNDKPTPQQLKSAISKFIKNDKECLVDVSVQEDIAELIKDYHFALDKENGADNETKYVAIKAISEKLIELKLLSYKFKNSNSTETQTSSENEEDLFEGYVAFEDSETESSSGVLDLDNPSDVEKNIACHINRIEELDEEEQEDYIKEHVASQVVDDLREQIGKKEENATPEINSNNMYAMGDAADELTQNQFGFDYMFQASAEAYNVINTHSTALLNLQQQLRLNPNNTTIQGQYQNKVTEIETALKQVTQKYENLAQNDPKYATNPEALQSAKNNIGTAISYWAKEAVKIAQGAPATSFQTHLETTQPSNAATALTTLVTPGSVLGDLSDNPMALNPNGTSVLGNIQNIGQAIRSVGSTRPQFGSPEMQGFRPNPSGRPGKTNF